MGTVQKLLHIAKERRAGVAGFLTKGDMEKLREVSRKPKSPGRKSSYRTWNCASCKGRYFYAVMKCPGCESIDIEKTDLSTAYGYGFQAGLFLAKR